MSPKGVLLIAHGSRDRNWVDLIENLSNEVQSNLPIVTGYLELVQGKSIADGIKKLEEINVEQIEAIPLFINSGSTHLEEIQYSIGLKEESRIPTDLEKINVTVPIKWNSPMDDHPYVIDILLERVNSISQDAENETVLLIAHGSDVPGFQSIWESTLNGITNILRDKLFVKDVQYATLHPDTVAQKARYLSKLGDLVVIPLFLSEGYFTSQHIPRKLSGLPYRYNGTTLLPHRLVLKWLEEKIKDVEG